MNNEFFRSVIEGALGPQQEDGSFIVNLPEKIPQQFEFQHSGIVVTMDSSEPVCGLENEFKYVNELINVILQQADKLYAHNVIELDDLPLFFPDEQDMTENLAEFKTKLAQAIEAKKQQQLSVSVNESGSDVAGKNLAKERVATSAAEISEPLKMMTRFKSDRMPTWVNKLYKVVCNVSGEVIFFSDSTLYQMNQDQDKKADLDGSVNDLTLSEDGSRSNQMDITSKLFSIFHASDNSEVKSILIHILDTMSDCELYSSQKEALLNGMKKEDFIIPVLSDPDLKNGHSCMVLSLLKSALYDDLFLKDNLASKYFVEHAYNLLQGSSSLTPDERELLLCHIAKAVSQSADMLQLVQSKTKTGFMGKLRGGNSKIVSGKSHLALLIICGELLLNDSKIRHEALDKNVFQVFITLLIAPIEGIRKVLQDGCFANEDYSILQLNYMMLLPRLVSVIEDHPLVIKTLKSSSIIKKMGDLWSYCIGNATGLGNAIRGDALHKKRIEDEFIVKYGDDALSKAIKTVLVQSIYLQKLEKDNISAKVGLTQSEAADQTPVEDLLSPVLDQLSLSRVKDEIKIFQMTMEQIHGDLKLETNRLPEQKESSGYQRGLRLHDKKFIAASDAHMTIAKQAHQNFCDTLQIKKLRSDDVKRISEVMQSIITNNLTTFFSNSGAVISESKRNERQSELEESAMVVMNMSCQNIHNRDS